METSIESVATRMRMLAAEIGGNHHSAKEAEELLNGLANELSEINMQMSLKLHQCLDRVDDYAGIYDSYRETYIRQENIKKHAEEGE
jgi:hypothetical protein